MRVKGIDEDEISGRYRESLFFYPDVSLTLEDIEKLHVVMDVKGTHADLIEKDVKSADLFMGYDLILYHDFTVKDFDENRKIVVY